jgi:hypothetical protein
MSKVAVGCASVETLQRRQAQRIADGAVPVVTRFMPKRADELVGGSLYWIVKHRIAARQAIVGFDVRPQDRRTIIRLSPELVRVAAVPHRAHQGWRYLAADDCPPDLGGDEGADDLPASMMAELSALFLL